VRYSLCYSFTIERHESRQPQITHQVTQMRDAMKITLNEEWTDLLEQYKDDHQDPRNQFCHSVGIPMIAASLPLGVSIIGLPLAIPLFGVGWGLQFIGHFFEGKKPSFVDDKRQLLVGAAWWTQKIGLKFIQTAR